MMVALYTVSEEEVRTKYRPKISIAPQPAEWQFMFSEVIGLGSHLEVML